MSKNFVVELIQNLRSANGKICVSIILPMHRFAPERQANSRVVKKALEKVSEMLFSKYDKEEATSLLQKLDDLVATIDFSRNLEGLGLYVSSDQKISVDFPFSVIERIRVGDKFELRELIQLSQLSRSYTVLVLSEKGARLFNGSGTDLNEVKDGQFPMIHRGDYVYADPVRSSSYAGYAHVKNFEKDKSEMKSIRLRNFFRKMDKVLENYLDADNSVVVLGAGKNTSLYLEVAAQPERVLEKIDGNYEFENEKEIADRTWPAMQKYFSAETAQLIKEFEESMGAGRAISGIQEIWTAAMEGKALKLLVEMNYRQPGYLGENNYQLHLHPPQHGTVTMGDAVEEIIDIVLDKSGQVIIVDDGLLKDYGRIAMITRY